MTIRYLDIPLSRFLESYTDADGKRCCRFMDSTSESTTSPQCISTNLDERTTANSQPVGPFGIPPGDLVHSSAHSQPV